MNVNIGELSAFFTAICWTITALSFEYAGKRVGSLSVNLIRLIFAFFLLSFYGLFSRGYFLPFDASKENILWLSISGIIGFVIGDLFLFQSFVLIGSRISLLIMSLSPPITAALGYFILHESLSYLSIIGMVITIFGILLVILNKEKKSKIKFSHPLKGIIFAFIGALGQSLGLIFTKMGSIDYDPFGVTQIRVISAIIGFSIFFSIKRGLWKKVFNTFKYKQSLLFIILGSFFGPFLGVTLSVVALKYSPTGIVSTITSITPVLIIPFSFFLFKERIFKKEIFGAIISVIGISILFIT